MLHRLARATRPRPHRLVRPHPHPPLLHRCLTLMPPRRPAAAGPGTAQQRVAALGRQLTLTAPHTTRALAHAADASADILGTVHVGAVSIPVTRPAAPERLPSPRLLLDTTDPLVAEHLEWLAKKWRLGQDVFLLSPPGPYARRLALTFAALLQLPYELVSLHRDVGEADLLQTRNLEGGRSLVYHNGPVVRAMTEGALLILEGTQRAERNILPLLNNILEVRQALVTSARLTCSCVNRTGSRTCPTAHTLSRPSALRPLALKKLGVEMEKRGRTAASFRYIPTSA